MDKHWLTPGYKKYINSETWQKKRKEKLDQVGNKCFHDGQMITARVVDEKGNVVDYRKIPTCKGPLQVHHMLYSRLGNERMSDLRVYCQKHHYEWHKRQSIPDWELE